jgi:hypothetical protein
MTEPGAPRTMLHPAEIRANLEAVRAGASDALRGRALLGRVDDAIELLEEATSKRGDVDARSMRRASPFASRVQEALARRVRELLRPSGALDHPHARWEALSVVVALLLAGTAAAAYFTNVRDYQQLHAVSDFLQGAEGLLTIVVIIAAWSYSTWRFERARRIEAVIDSIDRCRALILIIDAHALAKDFSRYWDPRRANGTDTVDGLHRDETIEYLAIGARISKLTAQIAASYGSVIQDHAVIAAIDSVSQLALSIERNALAKQEMIARGVGAVGAPSASRGADSGA